LRQAKGQAAIIDDPKILQGLVLKVGLAKTEEEVEYHLLNWPDADEEQS
ncbi:MAG: hypothetical protein JO202_17120, partial [Ktedonobacteraceae bacterium]|nr:hypothetical protein [Ktedonobacteraceae bacterium]